MTYEPTDPEAPTVVETRRVVTERPANTTGWVVAAIVAVVAIIAVAFMINNRTPRTDDQQIATAVEQGRMQGTLDAQSQLNAQSAAATQAQINAQVANERAATATSQAAADARASADQAAASVADAARDANDRISSQNAGDAAPVSPSPQ